MIITSECMKDLTHNLGSNPRFKPDFFSVFNLTTTYVVYNYDDQSYLNVCSFIFIPLSFCLPIYLSNYFSFFPSFLTPLVLYSVASRLAPAHFSGKEITGTDRRSL